MEVWKLNEGKPKKKPTIFKFERLIFEQMAEKIED